MSRAYKNNGIIPPPSNFSSTAGSSLVTGLSGIGKSTVIEKTLYRYPQTIRHKNYKGKPFDHTQIVWIKIDCPFNSTIKGLAYSFFEEIDQLLGTNYLDEVKKPKNNASILQNKMENIVSTYFIGVIVIDELQHLKSAKSGNAEEMQNFFVNLVNKVGIPIIYSGTYSVKKVLSSELKQARRVGTTHHLEPLEFNSPLFDYFIKSLWQYQWVKKVQDLNDDIFSVIHELTQGIPAFIISLFANAQAYAIESETEIINIETLNKAFENKMTSLHPAINALRSGRERDLLKFEDLIPIDFDLINSNPTEEELIEELFSAQGQPPKKDAPTKGKDTKIIPIQKDTKVDIDSKFNPDEYLADDA